MHRAGVTHFVEIGPAAVLTRLGAACLEGTGAVWLPSQRGEGDDGTEILRSLSRLHVDGAKLAWDRIAADGRRISLPGYAFQRRPYWVTDLPRRRSRSPRRRGTARAEPKPLRLRRAVGLGQAIERRPATFGDVPGLPSAGVVDQTWADHPLDAAVRLRPEFDRLAGLYVASALGRLGWRPVRGEAVELTALGRPAEPARAATAAARPDARPRGGRRLDDLGRHARRRSGRCRRPTTPPPSTRRCSRSTPTSRSSCASPTTAPATSPGCWRARSIRCTSCSAARRARSPRTCTRNRPSRASTTTS